jgi:hypothetical protein
MTAPSTTRPQPLQDIALDMSCGRGVWMGLLTALVSTGAISLSTSNALYSLAGLLPGVLALLATVLGAHGVANAGESKVTPISDPMTVVDGRLVPLVPAAAVPDPLLRPPAGPSLDEPPTTTERRLM